MGLWWLGMCLAWGKKNNLRTLFSCIARVQIRLLAKLLYVMQTDATLLLDLSGCTPLMHIATKCLLWLLFGFRLSFFFGGFDTCLGTSCALTPASGCGQENHYSVWTRLNVVASVCACVGLLPLYDCSALPVHCRPTLILLLGKFSGSSLEEAHLEKQGDADELPPWAGTVLTNAALIRCLQPAAHSG